MLVERKSTSAGTSACAINDRIQYKIGWDVHVWWIIPEYKLNTKTFKVILLSLIIEKFDKYHFLLVFFQCFTCR